MKFIASLALALLAVVPALAAPQDTASSSSAVQASSTISLTPQQTCIAACNPGDVNCQAACVGTAHPNASQANQTTDCAMSCDQGDGSPEATQKYSQCVQACISSYFPTSQTVAAAPGASTAASNAASATGAAASGTAASGSGPQQTGSSTATGSAASASKTGAASANLVGTSAFGLAGLFMALFAL